MRLRFCLVCGNEFREEWLGQAIEWLDDDKPITCGNCGADVWPLEKLSLAERRKLELAYAIDTASVVPVQGRFL